MLRFLLCDNTTNVELTSPDGQCVHSPVECLERASESAADVIVVRFAQAPVSKREALVILCAALKNNPRTKGVPILALLHSEHPQLLEDLYRARVDFVRYIGDATPSGALIRDLMNDLDQEDRTERQVLAVCPFIHHVMIDSRREMRVCGAYLDRMVLGEHRLRTLCRREKHLECEYFVNPRQKKSRMESRTLRIDRRHNSLRIGRLNKQGQAARQ